jgi:uncharacterized protein YkwD
MSWGSTRRLALTVLGSSLLSLASIGCTTISGSPRPAPSENAAPATSGAVAEVISLTNDRRASAGCEPVAAQGQLTRAAQLHAEDMAANRYFSHTSQDGQAPWDRARAQGYTGRGIGENIASGYPTPRAVVDAWMGSSGHRANIENCAWRHIGIGYDAASRTWVQLFGA